MRANVFMTTPTGQELTQRHGWGLPEFERLGRFEGEFNEAARNVLTPGARGVLYTRLKVRLLESLGVPKDLLARLASDEAREFPRWVADGFPEPWQTLIRDAARAAMLLHEPVGQDVGVED